MGSAVTDVLAKLLGSAIAESTETGADKDTEEENRKKVQFYVNMVSVTNNIFEYIVSSNIIIIYLIQFSNNRYHES